jgi:DME family drug/metabolite transporter
VAALSTVSHRRGLVYIAIAATAWGTGGAVAAVLYLNSGLGAVSVSFWRFLGGAVLLGLAWPFLGGGGAGLWRQFTAAPVRLVITGVGLAVYQTAYFAAVGAAGVAVATVVTLGAGPVLIAIGSRIWMDERLGRAGAVIMLSSLTGLALLVLGGGATSGADSVLGIGLALLSAVGYAGTTLLNRAMSKADAADPIGNAVIGFVVGALCLLPPALAADILPGPDDLGLTVVMLVYLGLGPSALAYALFFLGLTSVKATTAAVIALVEPLTAAVIGVALLDERLSPAAIAGGLLLLSAVIVLAVSSKPAAVPVPIQEPVH